MKTQKKRYHYLYKTECIPTGKFYVGMHSTYDLNDGYLGSGKRLRYSIGKYGKENHTIKILQYFESREELIAAEIDLITEDVLADPLCLNIKFGGHGGFHSSQLKGRQFSVEHRKKLSESHRGLKQTDETRRKRSEALKGRKVNNMRAVSIDGIVYESITAASKATGVIIPTIRQRLLSSNDRFINMFYLDLPK